MLPDAVLSQLRSTFADEVASRLGSLDGGDDLEQVRRDAHTLASSAWVVGEQQIGELARAVELDVLAGPRTELVTALRAYAP